MSRRKEVVCLIASLTLALWTAACGGSKAVTGGDPVLAGNAVLTGLVSGASDGLTVTAQGTSASAEVDDEGRFVMTSLPAGTVNLKFEGGGVNASLSVPGLQDGLVMSITVSVTGSSAQLGPGASCTPAAETSFAGLIEQISPGRLVVAGRTVDTGQNRKVWLGEKRIDISELQVGQKVKVWGTLRGDGVVVSDEIVALTSTPGAGEVWISFTGRVESVAASASASSVHANPNVGSYPTVVVAGRTVATNGETKFRWSDGTTLEPGHIKAGQTAYVEGWKKGDGTVRATTFRVEGSNPNPQPTWVSFSGVVQSISSSSTGVVHANPYVTPSFVIGGRTVKTDGSTAFKLSNGSALSAGSIVVGDQAYVEGWSKPEGYVLAAKIVISR